MKLTTHKGIKFSINFIIRSSFSVSIISPGYTWLALANVQMVNGIEEDGAETMRVFRDF